MGVVAVALRFVLLIAAFLCCILGVSVAAESDKNFHHVFKKIGHGDFEKGLDHVWSHANGGNGTATLLLSRLFLEFGDLENFEFDHIVPWSKNGRTEIDNCQMLCIKHHKELKNR